MAASKPTRYLIFFSFNLPHLVNIKHLIMRSGLLPSRRNTLARTRLIKWFRYFELRKFKNLDKSLVKKNLPQSPTLTHYT